jgi:hypothetical protein
MSDTDLFEKAIQFSQIERIVQIDDQIKTLEENLSFVVASQLPHVDVFEDDNASPSMKQTAKDAFSALSLKKTLFQKLLMN